MLTRAGYDLVCVTALPQEFRQARERNLRLHGFPIDLVHATDDAMTPASPKAHTLNQLRAVAFVDDYLPYLVGVDPSIHKALIMRGANGSPNLGEQLLHADSQHLDLISFARWWVG